MIKPLAKPVVYLLNVGEHRMVYKLAGQDLLLAQLRHHYE